MEPGKRGGTSCVRGMRITIRDVFSYLAAGMTEQQIREDLASLTSGDIQACHAYAADRERIATVAHRGTPS